MRVFMNEGDKRLHMLDRRLGQNAMAQIKDVPRSPPGALNNISRCRLYLLPGGEKHDRIKIPLNGCLISDFLPSGIERNAPVQADDIGAGLGNFRKQGGRIGSEVDHGNAFPLESMYEFARTRQNITAIVLR